MSDKATRIKHRDLLLRDPSLVYQATQQGKHKMRRSVQFFGVIM